MKMYMIWTHHISPEAKDRSVSEQKPEKRKGLEFLLKYMKTDETCIHIITTIWIKNNIAYESAAVFWQRNMTNDVSWIRRFTTD